MLSNLSNKLSYALRNIIGIGRITEDNIKNTLREVRIALLEADVALPIVQNFIKNIKNKSLGTKINKSFTPSQEFIKIVNSELISIMGSENNSLNLSVQPPAIILFVGLQGSGKTTSVSKLAKYLYKQKKKKVLVVSIDIYRPAAIKQLKILVKSENIDFFYSDTTQKPIDIALRAINQAKIKFYDILIIDSAGRMETDKNMMSEISEIHSIINPVETLFVMDSMTGQTAANTVKIFNEKLPLTGIILTKVDSDTRGGSALSIKYLTGKPIKFLGTGEKNNDLELFCPNKLAKRILGMEDTLSIIKDIKKKIDYTKAKIIISKLDKNHKFNLIDFMNQIKQIKNIGNIDNIINKFSNINKKLLFNNESRFNNNSIIRIETIFNSMSIKERLNPDIIKGSRKKRIAKGSGTKVQDVNLMLKQFNDAKKITKKIKKTGISKIIRNIKNIISS